MREAINPQSYHVYFLTKCKNIFETPCIIGTLTGEDQPARPAGLSCLGENILLLTNLKSGAGKTQISDVYENVEER